MQKILFFAEAVTLAHIARPAAVAEVFAETHEVTLACSPKVQHLTSGGKVAHRDLYSISSSSFINSLKQGKPVYDFETLKKYVYDDLDLINSIQPDLIVGDFRLSLSISARLCKIPFVSIANSYWSPFYKEPLPLPVLPWTSAAPISLANTIFNWVSPLVLARHCKAMNKTKHHFGMQDTTNNLKTVYTDADWLALADSPEIYPLVSTPKNHWSVGPITWQMPKICMPDWPKSGRPIAYLGLGSSGDHKLTSKVIQGLLSAGFDIWHSCSGVNTQDFNHPRVWSAPYLPGNLVCDQVDLVVCNGGSLGVQQAILAGVPVIGIASNMDQFMNMLPIESLGAGILLRADRITKEKVTSAAFQLIESNQAKYLATVFQKLNFKEQFVELFSAIKNLGRQANTPAGCCSTMPHST